MAATRSFCSAVGVYSCLILLPLQILAQLSINPFSQPVTIQETTTQETEIEKVICNVGPADFCICNLANRGSDPFDVWKKGNNPDYRVYYVGVTNGGPLSYKTKNTYYLNITCRNSTQDRSSQILEVDVIQNLPPIFTSTAGSAQLDVLANNGPFVYQVTATDAENDPLTYSIKTTRPHVNYFTIDPKSGVVSVTTNLNYITESSVILTLQVTDGHTSVDNFELTVNITNLNQRPDIINLPATIYVPETAAIGSTIMTLTIIDSAAPYPLQPPTCTILPSNERYKFNFVNGGASIYHIKLTSQLDYETTNLYRITCEVSDGYLTSQNEVLNLYVDDVNEPPVFDDVAYYCNLEESDAGVSSCNLGLHDILSDPEGDIISSVTFRNGNNSNRFRYNKATTMVTFNLDYDVDVAGWPTAVVLQLQATDSKGASSQVPVYIKISDANDNTCRFMPSTVQTYSAHQSTPLGTLTRLAATDDDLTSPNNYVTYEMVGAVPPDSINYIAAYSDGTVAYIGQIPDSIIPRSYSLLVRCKDGGNPRRSSEATFVLTYMPTTSTITTTTTTTSTTTTSTTTTPTTTTTESPDIWDDPVFIGVFTALMCLLAIGLLASAYLCARYCGACGSPSVGDGSGFQEFCCPKSKPKKVEPVDDYFNDTVRTNPDYADDYWRKGDKFETGKEKEPRNPLEGAPVRLSKPTDRGQFSF